LLPAHARLSWIKGPSWLRKKSICPDPPLSDGHQLSSELPEARLPRYHSEQSVIGASPPSPNHQSALSVLILLWLRLPCFPASVKLRSRHLLVCQEDKPSSF
jgi:hypothetical protein